LTGAQTGGVTRLRTCFVVVALLASACTSPENEPGDEADPQASPSPTVTSSTPESSEPSPPPAKPPHPVSLQALMAKEYDGRGLRLGAERASTGSYRQHTVSYRSGRLRITGVLNIPRGRGPFPAVVLAHGHIDTDIYVNGQGMARELDRFGAEGYVTLHVDYRNHAGSDDDPAAERRLRLGYTEDVINAVLALRRWKGPVDDDRIGLVGRSMGGGVVYNVLVVKPGLVDAGVVFAPVSSNTVDNFERWIRPNPERSSLAGEIIKRYGEPARARRFWRNVSPRTFFGRVTEPVLIHHGTSDDSCPIVWSRRTTAALERAGADVTFRIYQGEEHAFYPQWPTSMNRTLGFLRRHLS
jgi:dipeptidyl aminopeptidase/acylaminoacyl peptidase